MNWSHQPVLLTPILEALAVSASPKAAFLDCTLGLGGHAKAILQARAGLTTKYYGLDQDPEALRLAANKLGAKSLHYHWGNFAQIQDLAAQHGWPQFDGILFDLGVSSMQLDNPERGFSFQQAGDLDMRMDPQNPVSAYTIINTWSEDALSRLFWQYGEERLSKRIARAVVQTRKQSPIGGTLELAGLIEQCYPVSLRHKKPHPATRVFQALRIEANQEMVELPKGLRAAFDLLAPGGRLAVISFHSLEDRVVKRLFLEAAASGQFQILTKKPVIASESEQEQNPRSRSAKLRVIERTAFFG